MSRRQRIVTFSALALLGAIVIVFLIALSLTQTDYGQGQVRRFVQSWVNGKVKGKMYIGRISGGLFSGVTIDTVAIRDDEDSLFVSTGRVRVRYDMRDIFDKRILLSHLDVEHPVVHVRQHENGDWNWRRIFPEGPQQPPGGRGFGDFIVMDSADVHDGQVILTLPWHPSDSLEGRQRDSAIAYALGSLTRHLPGNDWPSEIRRTREGFARTWRFTGAQSSFAYVRIAQPDSIGRFFQIAKATLKSSDPPLDVTSARGNVKIVGDSAWLDFAHFDLPGSTGKAKGKIFWGGPLPIRYAIHITGDSVSLKDVAWVYPTLPMSGGGRMDLDINNVSHPPIMDYAITRMDVRSTRSRLIGDMTYAVGGPVLAVKDVRLQAAPLNFDLLRALNGKKFPYDWQGDITGSVRAAGGPLNRFSVDESRFTFADANVPGAITKGSAHGELDILYPAYTAFHGLDVNVETLDLRTLRYLNPAFLELKGTVSGTTRLDSSWLDVRFSNADIVHHDGDLPTSRFLGNGRVTWGEKYMTYDMALEANPVSMTTLAHSYPDIRFRGNYTGPISMKGIAPSLEVATTLTGAGGTLAYTGTVDANLPTYGAHGTGTVTGLNVRALLENQKAPRTNLTGNYGVEFVGDSIVTGTGTLKTSLKGTIEKIDVASSNASVRVDKGMAFIDTLLVQSASAHASASGSVAMTDAGQGKLGFVVSVDSLSDVKRYVKTATSIPTDSLRGSVRIAGEISGNPHDMSLNGTLAGHELGAEGKRIEAVSGKFVLNDLANSPNGSLEVHADSVTAKPLGFTSVDATARLDSSGLASFNAMLASANGAVSKLRGTAKLAGDTTNISLDSGFVTVSNGSSYRLDAPAHITLMPGGGSLDSLLLSYSKARLAVRDVRLVGDSVRGNVRTDSVDLGILEAFIPGVKTAKGALVANVDVSGTVKQPTLVGQFSITNGTATLTSSGTQLNRINADIALARDTVFVKRLSAETQRERRGTMSVDGFVSLVRSENPEFALRGRAENFHIIEKPGLASLDVSTDGEMTLSGPYRAATVTGAVRVDRGTIYIPELITKKIVDLSDPEFAGVVDTLLAQDRKLLPETPSDFTRNLTLENVQVNIGDAVWLRSSEANVKLGGSLNVTLGPNAQTGEQSQLALEGTLNAVRGTYRLNLVDPFVQPTFDVESGSLRFFGTPDLNPTLDIRAIHTIRQPRQQTANVRDIRVRVTISGTLEHPLLSLDNPDNLPLSQSDLLSYLITGEPAIAFDNTTAEYQSQLASLAVRYGGNLLTNAIPRNVLDIVELQTAGSTTQARSTDPYYYNLLNTRAILGKQIGNQWFIGLSTGLCVVNASNFVENFGLKLEYRFNSIYSAQAGIEPGSSDLTCARSTASQIQQQTPRQLGFDFFRTWRF
jgi:translocation and assembly module TamB